MWQARVFDQVHEIVLKEARTMARLAGEGGDDGTNDLIVSDVIRRNELQVWFVAELVRRLAADASGVRGVTGRTCAGDGPGRAVP
jgi:hypothetical protein